MSDQNEKIREALNRHGVFLKKAVLEKIPFRELKIYEEMGSSFGGTRVADIVAVQKFADRTLYLIIECKRVADDRRWVFYRHIEPRIRVARHVGGGKPTSEFRIERNSCSDGFEFPIRGKSDNPIADQDPVFKAASQLSAAYLGVAQDRWLHKADGLPPEGEYFVPVLVTTAKLSIVMNSFDAAPISTGRLDEKIELKDVAELVLKHPFPTPEGVAVDFRQGAIDPWQHRFAESVYIVHANSLVEFLDPLRREGFAFAQSP